MNRISAVMEQVRANGRKLFIPFLTAGYPTREATVDLVRAIDAAGADVLELGMPFSDPMADASFSRSPRSAPCAASAASPSTATAPRRWPRCRSTWPP